MQPASGGQNGTIMIEHCELSNNFIGLYVDAGQGAAAARLSNSNITANGQGILSQNGGQIITFRTNMLAGNTTDGSTPFSVSLK